VDYPLIAVSQAGTDRLSALAAVFGRAFVDEPMMRWPMGEGGDLSERFTRCFALFLEIALGLSLVTEAGSASGAAVWIPPNQFESWTNHPWNQSGIHALTNDDGRRYDKFGIGLTSKAPRNPCGSSTPLRWIQNSKVKAMAEL